MHLMLHLHFVLATLANCQRQVAPAKALTDQPWCVRIGWVTSVSTNKR